MEIACVTVGTFNVCKALANNQKLYVCEVENCDETCGVTYCRLKVETNPVCII